MGQNAWRNKSAAVERDGMRKLSLASAHNHLIGMEELVCYVLLAKYGIIRPILVFVRQELSGITNSVQ